MVSQRGSHPSCIVRQANSRIAHGVSATQNVSTGGGPYGLSNTSVLPPLAHNPTAHRLADGSYLIYHIGNGKAHKDPMHCHNGTTPGAAVAAAWDEPAAGLADTLMPNMLHSNSTEGPWEAVGAGASYGECNNPAAWQMKNGTVLLVCKVTPGPEGWRQFAIYTADTWRGPYHFRRLTPVYGEDAYVWQSATSGDWHMLFHAMHPKKVPSTAWSAGA